VLGFASREPTLRIAHLALTALNLIAFVVVPVRIDIHRQQSKCRALVIRSDRRYLTKKRLEMLS